MKQQKTASTLIVIASIILGIAGIALALISIFGNITSKWPLPAALACVVLGQALNIIYNIKKNKEHKS